MFKKILFPVDLTDNSGLLFPFVLSTAQFCGATLYVLHIAEKLSKLGGSPIPHPSEEYFSSDIQSRAEKLMKNFYDEHLYGLENVEHRVVQGDPAEEVLKFASDIGIDLIVMGTHGRKGLDRIIFGSVAEEVIRNSFLPVMVLNPHKMQEAGTGSESNAQID